MSKYYNLDFFYFAQWGTIVVRSITTMNIIDTDVDIVPESEANGKNMEKVIKSCRHWIAFGL